MENFARDVQPVTPEPRVPTGTLRLVRVNGHVLPVPERMIRELRLTFYEDGVALDLDRITLGFVP